MEERTPKFEIGQQVQLKSGSPTMLISTINTFPRTIKPPVVRTFSRSQGVYDYVFNGTYICKWFDDLEVKENVFEEELLIEIKN